MHSRAVVTAGRSDPPLLMLHGFGDTARTWGRLQDRLGGHGLATIAVDQPGHGEADAVRSGASLQDQMIEFARAAAASLPQPPVVVGNSMGGANALLLAARHPEVVRAVVAIAPAAIDHPDWMRRGASRARRDGEGSDFKPSAVQRRAAQVIAPAVGGLGVGAIAFGNPLRAPRAMRADWRRRLSDPHVRRSLREVAMAFSREYLREPLPLSDVTVPVLALWGDRDRLTSISSRTALEEHVEDLEFVTFPGMGHMPQVEAPGRTTKAILAFLDRLRDD